MVTQQKGIRNSEMAYFILIAFMFVNVSAGWAENLSNPDYLLVKKKERMLYLIKNGKPVRQYKIVLGHNPVGHKVEKGDYRTPEGLYFLDWRKKSSCYYKSIHISYPNEKDLKKAMENGVDPGGMIMIHGFPNGFNGNRTALKEVDWTTGCIAVTNREMDEIWSCVKDGTLIEIVP